MSRKFEYHVLLNSYEWQAKREEVINRAMGFCEWCLKPTDDFNVHHLEYDSFHPAKTPVEKLVAICRDCHDQHHWNLRLREYSNAKIKHIEKYGFLSEEAHQKLIKQFDV